ncbi:MAG: aspartyl/asparaginyl beta-hydroxylase domain-containing protein, partial [Pseudomonadota bacterium]
QGKAKSAGAFYQSALAVAARMSFAPPELQPAISRAQQKTAEYAQRFEAFLRDALSAAAATADKSANGAFGRSLDLMFGKRQIYGQQPQKYFFPELPNIQFYNRNRFDWVEKIEAYTDRIANELATLIEQGSGFEPYVQQNADRPRADHQSMVDNPDWSAFFLWKDGARVEENAKRCPATMEALSLAPAPSIPGNSPTALFSMLRPGAGIPPHHGLINTRLICHLPLIVPGDCALRVGDDTRAWKRGEMLIFDDTIEHEAWNNSADARIVLLFDIEQPAMTPEEHQAVEKLFAAIEAY